MIFPDPFDRALHRVETAKRELLIAVPSPRGVPGRPIAEALIAFEERLREAGEILPAAHPARDNFRDAIAEALRRAERVRLDAPALDYEGLVTVLADLIEPLDALAEEPLAE